MQRAPAKEKKIPWSDRKTWTPKAKKDANADGALDWQEDPQRSNIGAADMFRSDAMLTRADYGLSYSGAALIHLPPELDTGKPNWERDLPGGTTTYLPEFGNVNLEENVFD